MHEKRLTITHQQVNAGQNPKKGSYFMGGRTAVINKNQGLTRMWKSWNPRQCRWGNKKAQLLGKTVQRFLKNLKTESPCDPAVPPLGLRPNEEISAHPRSQQHRSQPLQSGSNQCPPMDRGRAVHRHAGILISLKAGRGSDTCCDVGQGADTGGHLPPTRTYTRGL